LQNIAPAAASDRAAGGASGCARVQDVRCDGMNRDAWRPASQSTSVLCALHCASRQAFEPCEDYVAGGLRGLNIFFLNTLI